MEAKKISFGFSKTTKGSNLISKGATKPEPKVELIKCLEGQEIKLVEEKPEEKPLVIPLVENRKTSTALASLMKRRAVLLGEEEPDNTNAQSEQTKFSNNIDETEDLDKRAARELLADIHSNGNTDAASTLVLPVVKPDDLPLEGAKESSLDDYEKVPVEAYGIAMLRGMGWQEPLKADKKGCPTLDETPMVRPKGMGLGADKAISKKPVLVAPEANEVLEIKRNAYVRILAGKHKDHYGQIEGFDDYANRVIVKMAIGGNKEAFNEFLCQPVSRKEYTQYGKCINSSKYEEYKKRENEFGHIILNQNDKDSKRERYTSPENEKKIEKLSASGNVEKYIKKENNRDIEYDYKREKETFTYKKDKVYHDEKLRSRNDGRDELERENYKKGDKKDVYKESKRYQYQTEHHRDYERNSQQNYKRQDRVLTKDRQKERDRDRYMERSEKHKSKAIHMSDSSSETQSDSYTSKHKKTKKTKRPKKKSKGSKSKYRSETSNSESSSSDTDSTSSSSEEERRRKLKKKTKKSKKQRERSGCRDRR